MYNQEYAFVIPDLGGKNPLDTFAQQRAYNDHKEMLDEQRAQQERDRQDRYMQSIFDQIDPKTYATGTIYDPTVHQTIGDIHRKAAGMIKEGKGYADVVFGIGKDIATLGDWTSKAKNQRALLEKQVEEFSKNPYIDKNKLLQASLAMSFHNMDGTMKDPSQIDPNYNPIAEIIKGRPNWVYKCSSPFYKTVEAMEDTEVGDTVKTRDKSGRVISNKYSGKIKPFEEVWVDNNDGARAKARIRTKETVSPAGKVERVIDDAGFKRVFGDDTGNEFMLNAEFDALYRHKSLKPEEAEYYRRKLATDMLSAARTANPLKNEDVDMLRPAPINVHNHVNNAAAAPVNDLYGKIYSMADDRRQRKVPYLQTNLLPSDAQEFVIQKANAVGSNTIEDGVDETTGKPKYKRMPYTQADLKVILNDDGLGVYDVKSGRVVTFLDQVGTNLKVQPNAKAKAAVVSKGNAQQKPAAPKFQFINGKQKF